MPKKSNDKTHTVDSTKEKKMKEIYNKKLVKTYKAYTRLTVDKNQLQKLGYKIDDSGNYYLVAFHKDNRHKNKGLHVVNHIFRYEE
jgi:hypothetical protein